MKRPGESSPVLSRLIRVIAMAIEIAFPAGERRRFHRTRLVKRKRGNKRGEEGPADRRGMPSIIRCLFTCCTYHWVELWLFRWPPGLQGAQSSRGVSLFTPLAGGTAPVATGAGDAVGLSPSSPPNTGHSIHVLYSRLSSPGKTLTSFAKPGSTGLVLVPVSALVSWYRPFAGGMISSWMIALSEKAAFSRGNPRNYANSRDAGRRLTE